MNLQSLNGDNFKKTYLGVGKRRRETRWQSSSRVRARKLSQGAPEPEGSSPACEWEEGAGEVRETVGGRA